MFGYDKTMSVYLNNLNKLCHEQYLLMECVIENGGYQINSNYIYVVKLIILSTRMVCIALFVFRWQMRVKKELKLRYITTFYFVCLQNTNVRLKV